MDNPNYQYVAARLLLFGLTKQVYGGKEYPTLEGQILGAVGAKVYDHGIYDKYSLEEIHTVETFIDHDRDLLFTYAGLRQVVDKYLVQDRSTGQVFETPQFMYIMIALTMFAEYPKEKRLNYVNVTMTQSASTESTSQHQSWQVSEHPFVNLHLVFWLMLMTPSIVSLAAIWLLSLIHI